MSQVNLTSDERERCAHERGLLIVEPYKNELFIDADSEVARGICKAGIGLAAKAGIQLTLAAEWQSRTPGHWHMIVLVENFEGRSLPQMLRIALQASLGSDWKRELLSVCRHEVLEIQPTTFFETPERVLWIDEQRGKLWITDELPPLDSKPDDCDIPF